MDDDAMQQVLRTLNEDVLACKTDGQARQTAADRLAALPGVHACALWFGERFGEDGALSGEATASGAIFSVEDLATRPLTAPERECLTGDAVRQSLSGPDAPRNPALSRTVCLFSPLRDGDDAVGLVRLYLSPDRAEPETLAALVRETGRALHQSAILRAEAGRMERILSSVFRMS